MTNEIFFATIIVTILIIYIIITTIKLAILKHKEKEFNKLKSQIKIVENSMFENPSTTEYIEQCWNEIEKPHK